MLVAHSHRFIFIKTRKTAGSSVEAALRGYMAPGDIITPLPAADLRGESRYGGPAAANYTHTGLRARVQAALGQPGKRLFGLQRARFVAHSPAAEVRRKLDRAVWDGYLKIAIARNPYDMLVSLYFDERNNGRLPAGMSFDSFVRSRFARPRNIDLCTVNGRLAVDVLLRYEQLEADLAALGARLGLGSGPAERLAHLHLNSGKRASPRIAAYYDADLQRYVAARYADEFELFGYDPKLLPDGKQLAGTAQKL